MILRLFIPTTVRRMISIHSYLWLQVGSVWEIAYGSGSIPNRWCATTWPVHFQTQRCVWEVIGGCWASFIIQGARSTGDIAFFCAPFGRGLGGGASITRMVGVCTSEMFLVASRTGLLAVTLIFLLAVRAREVVRRANGTRKVLIVWWWTLGQARRPVEVGILAEKKATNLLLSPFTTVTRIGGSLSLFWVNLWPSHGVWWRK